MRFDIILHKLFFHQSEAVLQVTAWRMGKHYLNMEWSMMSAVLSIFGSKFKITLVCKGKLENRREPTNSPPAWERVIHSFYCACLSWTCISVCLTDWTPLSQTDNHSSVLVLICSKSYTLFKITTENKAGNRIGSWYSGAILLQTIYTMKKDITASNNIKESQQTYHHGP